MKHLLVPLDGSALAEAALPTAAGLARRLGARLTLLHVLEALPPETVHGQPHLAQADEAERYLEGVAQRPLFGALVVDLHVHLHRAGDVPESLMAHAHELGADILVLSTHGGGGLRDLLFGSIALRALQRGQTPLLLVSPTADGGSPPFRCERILVPLDGSAGHEPSLPVASGLAQACGARVDLVMIVPTPGTLSGHQAATRALLPLATKAVLDLAEREAAEYVQQLSGRLASSGVASTAYVGRGEPVASLVEAAEQVAADLVVMATHARGAIAGFWSGSLTPQLMQRLGRPMLLVHAEGAEPVR